MEDIFAPKPDNRILLANAITPLLDEALVARTKAEYESGRGSGSGDVAKHRIGAGYIGVDCARQLAYKYHKSPKRVRAATDSGTSPGELQRHAEAGFWTEEHVAKWMRDCGFNLLTVDVNTGSQFGYKKAPGDDGKYRIAGEIDGVILSGPDFTQVIPDASYPPFPWLWESKKATDKKFKKFESEGVKEADLKYYGQLQTNMLYLQVPSTLFTMLNLDSMKFYFELVQFDPQHNQFLQDRAAKVLESESPDDLPKIARSQSDFRCKWCPYDQLCWNEDRKTTKANPPESFKFPF